MSSISNDISKLKSSALNTTINAEVLAAFRLKCKQQGIAMNTILETFMRQYIKGGFYLKFGRESGMVEVEIDESEADKPVADIATTITDTKTGTAVKKKETIKKPIKDNFGEIVEEE